MRSDLGFAGFWLGVGLREKVGQVCNLSGLAVRWNEQVKNLFHFPGGRL